ncbi:MAG: hypothetical protein QXQ53_03845 [Candidatus Methanosuratincola sp.]
MPNARGWDYVLLLYNQSKIDTWKHRDANILTFDKLPAYVKTAVPLGFGDELPTAKVVAFGFDIITNAPKNTVINAFRSAMNEANARLPEAYQCTIAHAYLAEFPGYSRPGYAGNVYWVGGLLAVSPLLMATGLRLGQAGAVLTEIARLMTSKLRDMGYLSAVDFSNPDWDYHLSVLETVEGVITSGEVWRPEPTQPTTPQGEAQKWYEREDIKWILIGLGAILLLAILLRR